MTTVGTISLQLVEIPADFAAVRIRVKDRIALTCVSIYVYDSLIIV